MYFNKKQKKMGNLNEKKGLSLEKRNMTNGRIKLREEDVTRG